MANFDISPAFSQPFDQPDRNHQKVVLLEAKLDDTYAASDILRIARLPRGLDIWQIRVDASAASTGTYSLGITNGKTGTEYDLETAPLYRAAAAFSTTDAVIPTVPLFRGSTNLALVEAHLALKVGTAPSSDESVTLKLAVQCFMRTDVTITRDRVA